MPLKVIELFGERQPGRSKDVAMLSEEYHILYIGDESSHQRFLQRLRDAVGADFEVRRAGSWQSAEPQIPAGGLDAVVWDSPASEVDLAFLNQARQKNDGIPFLVLVPENQKLLGRQALAAGADDYLLREAPDPSLFERSLRHLIERKRAESSLRQWERRFEDWFENSKDILFTLDLNGRVTSVNKAAEEVMGWRREQAVEKNIKSLVAPEHAALCQEMMRRIVNQEPVEHLEIAMLRKDGRKVLLEASARLVRSNEKIDCIQGIARDVTDRRQLENMVRQSQKLEAIGRLSGVGARLQ